MAVLWIILGLVLFLLVSLLLLKLTIYFNLIKENGESVKIDFSIMVANRKIDISKYLNRGKTVKGKATENIETKDLSDERFIEKISKFRTNIARGKYTYLLSKRYVRKKIIVENLDFSLVFGLGDAAQTGIATGVVWGGIYNVFGFVDSLFTVKTHNFNVTPVFECEGIAYKVNTKVHCRVLNLILITLAVMINYIKTGKNL